MIKILFTTMLLLFCHTFSKAQDVNDGVAFVIYTDSIQSLSLRAKNQNRHTRPAKPRTTMSIEEIQSRNGMFVASFDDNYFMTEGVLHCLKQAIDSWEERISLNKPVKFHVCLSESLDPDIAIQTTVGYSLKQRNVSCPDNLLNQTNVTDLALNDTIRINAYAGWNTSWAYDDSDDGTISLTNGLLRNIARILGFGCSVVKRSNSINFAQHMAPSVFDSLIRDSNDRSLSSFAMTRNPDFDSFFSGDTKLRMDSYTYDLYDTEGFVPNKSGLYFSLGRDNLMEMPTNDDLEVKAINYETLDVMRKIGWNMKAFDFEIISDSTDALGYGSIYRNHDFVLRQHSTGCNTVTTWSYQVFDNTTKTYETIHTATGSHFSIQPTVTENSLDDFACYQARVTADFNGVVYYFPLNLETRPLIENIQVSDYVSTDNRHYQIKIDVRQRGCNTGTILVMDDTGSVREFEYQNQTITVSNLLKGHPIYIDVTLANSYGTANSFVETEPYLIGNVSQARQVTAKMSVYDDCQTDTLRDMDMVTLQLPQNIESRDSLCWYMNIGEASKKIFPTKQDSLTYVFPINHKTVDVTMTKTYGKEMIRYEGRESWGGVWDTDEPSYFRCNVYKGENKKKLSLTLKSRNYVLDVLPSLPTIQILDAREDKDDDRVIVTKIRNNVSNADAIFIWVYQNFSGAYQYLDTIITDNLDDIYTVYVPGWGNDISCQAHNEYGYYEGPKVRICQTGLSDIRNNADNISINDQLICLPADIDYPITIYSTTGKAIKVINNPYQHSVQIPKGLYIIDMRHSKTKTHTIRKVTVK